MKTSLFLTDFRITATPRYDIDPAQERRSADGKGGRPAATPTATLPRGCEARIVWRPTEIDERRSRAMEELVFWVPTGAAIAAIAGFVIHGLINGPWWGP
jgi:hypothetical protein